MTLEEALAIVDAALAPNRLSTIQELVFRQCWVGQTYQEIAEVSGYDPDYVRMIGSRLWHLLSESFGERVTKSNIRAVFRQHFQDQTSQESTGGTPADHQLERSHLLDFPGAPLPLDSPFYIMRPPTETYAYEEVVKPGTLIRIRAPDKWGKTSLINRIAAHASSCGYQVVRLNLSQADISILSSLDRFLRWFCANITQQLQMEPQLNDFWDADLGSKVSCTLYLQAYVLAKSHSPVVVALDDIQCLFEHPAIAQDFLPMLRLWHEEAKNLPTWAQLRLVVAYSSEVYVALKVDQSPFNVGFPLRLQKLTLEQTLDFAARHGLDWISNEQAKQSLARLRAMVDGNPYLLHLAFYSMRRGEVTIEQVLEDAPRQSGIYRDHLRNYLTIFQQYPELAQSFREVVLADGAVELDAIAVHKLESMGLVNLLGDMVAPTCDLYRLYFRDRLSQF